MSKVLSRRDAVKRIAKRFGYPDERAEDIAQEAALQLIQNPRLVTQSAKQAFIDVLRGSREGERSRDGVVHQPVFESAFENYANFINGYGSGDDLESRAIARSELSHVIDCFTVLRPQWRRALELYVEGFSLAEISKQFGCSESRVSQLVKVSRERLEAAVIQKGVSRQEQRRRKWLQSQALPREVQERPRVSNIIPFPVAAFRCQAIKGMVSFKVPKVPQSLFTSF